MSVLRIVLVRCDGGGEGCEVQFIDERTSAADLPASAREAREMGRKRGWLRVYPAKGGPSQDLCPVCIRSGAGAPPSS